MSCIGFSQHLKPIVQVINNQQYFCFNKQQSKKLAKLLVLGSYNDSLINKLHNENIRLRLLVKNKEQLSDLKQHQLDNFELLVENLEVETRFLQQKITARDCKIKRSKTYRFLLGVGLLITTTLIIIK